MRHRLTAEAKDRYKATAEKEPKALQALMGLGIIYQRENNYSKAQEYYEKVLTINPNFVPAANNLAYIYAEQGGNIDIALNLAQKAREKMPQDANVADTLGWIYYKKNVYSTAITYLKEAAEKMPEQPVVRYHLGMAYYKNGNRDLARQELNRALSLSQDFEGANEAKKALENL
jgi:tetratricopeptide (TPR) repeat protein